MWKYTQSVGDFFLFEVQECYVCQATDLFRKAHPQLVSIHPKIADFKKWLEIKLNMQHYKSLFNFQYSWEQSHGRKVETTQKGMKRADNRVII